MKRIVLTGGGTAGHVTPNIALIPELKKEGYEIFYIGSHNGIERKLIEEYGIPYYGISSGKLRRYFDLKNFTDPFRVVKGLFDAKKLMKKLSHKFLMLLQNRRGLLCIELVVIVVNAFIVLFATNLERLIFANHAQLS